MIDSDAGTPDIIKLRVDNYHSQYSDLSLLNPGEQHDSVEIICVLYDSIGQDTLTLACEYSTDSTVWQTSGNIVVQSSFYPGDYEDTIKWYSNLDLPNHDNWVWFRVRATDGWEYGPYTVIKFWLDNNVAPTLNITYYPSEDTGDVFIKIYPTDPEGDNLNYILEYSLDQTVWQSASCTLYPNTLNDTDTIIWHTKLDTPVADSECNVWFRAIPMDNDTGNGDTVYFRVDNYHTQPVSINPIFTEQSDSVEIMFTLNDVIGLDSQKIHCEYIWLGSVFDATVVGDTDGLAWNYSGSIIWVSKTDLPSQEGNVQFIISSNDYWRYGGSDTITFWLDNNEPPQVIFVDTLEEDTGRIPIKLRIIDLEGDSISLTVRYSQDKGVTWDTTSAYNLIHDTLDTFVLTWNSMSDLPNTEKRVWFEVIPHDSDVGISDTLLFTVDNYHIQTVNIVSPLDSAEVHRNIPIKYSLTDLSYDRLRIITRYFDPDSGKWFTASTYGQVDNIDSATYAGDTLTITWISGDNLPHEECWTWFKIIPTDNWINGTPDSVYILVDNNDSPVVKIYPTYEAMDSAVIPIEVLDGETECDTFRFDAYYVFRGTTYTCSVKYLPDEPIYYDTIRPTNVIWYFDTLFNNKDTFARFFVIPYDHDTGSYFYAYVYDTLVHIDNYHNEQVAIASTGDSTGRIEDTLIHSGNVWVWYTITDPTRDIIKLVLEYTTDTTSGWNRAYLVSDTIFDSTQYVNALIWKSKHDLLPFKGFVWLRIIAFDKVHNTWIVGDTSTYCKIKLYNNSPPSVVMIETPSGEQSGDVRIRFKVTDNETDYVDVECFYVIDDSQFKATLLAQSDTQTLYPTTDSTYEVVWNSLSDINLQDKLVRFRIVPSDLHSTGNSATTGEFRVDNYHIQKVIMQDTLGEHHDDIKVPFTIVDSTGDEIGIFARYSLDGSVWKTPKLTGNTEWFDTSCYDTSIIWNSYNDLGNVDTIVYFAIYTYDNWDTGYGDTTVIHVDNNRVPDLMVVNVIGDTFLGRYTHDISVYYRLRDNEYDKLKVKLYYKTATQWFEGTVKGDTILDSAEYSAMIPELVWTSFVDLPTYDDTVWLKLIPIDNDTGVGDSTWFVLLNNTPPVVETVFTPQGEQQDTVITSIKICDPDTDSLWLEVYYSVDTGKIWQLCTGYYDFTQIGDTVVFGYRWLSKIDLPDTDCWVIKRFVVSEKYHPKADTGYTGLFKLDNIENAVVDSYYPSDTLIWARADVVVRFTLPIELSSCSTNIHVFSKVMNSDYEGRFELLDTRTVRFIPSTYFAANDTVIVEVDTGVKDIYKDNILKGDTFEFYTTYLADYNLDRVVDFVDVVGFFIPYVWTDTCAEYEIGPAHGKLPHLVCTPDGKVDIEDLAVLISEWDWVIAHGGIPKDKTSCFSNSSSIKTNLSYIVEDEDAYVLIDYYNAKSLYASEISLKYGDGLEYIGYEVGEQFADCDEFISKVYKDNNTVHLYLARLAHKNLYLKGKGKLLVLHFKVFREDTAKISIKFYENTEKSIETSCSVYSITLKPQEKAYLFSFNVNPIPAETKIRLRYSLGKIKGYKTIPFEVKLYDITGRLIKTILQGCAKPGKYEKDCEVDVPTGIYFVRFETKGYSKTMKLVVIK